MSKTEFLSIYGAAAYLKLLSLKELLEERSIDIGMLTNQQIAKMIGIEYHTG